jgi:hypothetical protein
VRQEFLIGQIDVSNKIGLLLGRRKVLKSGCIPPNSCVENLIPDAAVSVGKGFWEVVRS